MSEQMFLGAQISLKEMEMWFDLLFEDIQDGQCFKDIALKFIVLHQKR